MTFRIEAWRYEAARELQARLRHRRRQAVQLWHGDSRAVLATLPADSLDSCVTDPPYALVSVVKRFGSLTAAPAHGNEAYMRASAGFMGKQWDTGECAMDASFWAEVLRVLKPGAHLVAFGATRGYHRMACAIEDAGFEIRDSLAWLYGTGFPKSHDVSKGVDRELGAVRTEIVGKSARHGGGIVGAGTSYEISPDVLMLYAPATPEAATWEGWGTALKPAFEPIVLARKPLSESTVAANVLRWGTGALNVGACRVGSETRYNPSASSNEIYGQFKGAEQEGREAGRWPANVVHDGSPEVVGAFPTTAPSKRNSKPPEDYVANEKNAVYGKGMGGGYHAGHDDQGNGSAARFFYSAKASAKDRNGSKHPTVKPVSLMTWLTRLVTPPGGCVLDPFAGSGTTGSAAREEGFGYVLIEREAEYVADIERRLGVVANLVCHASNLVRQTSNSVDSQLNAA